MIKKGEKVENSVRVAREDGSTAFLRPLPGAARMYVETDVYPILVDKGLLERIRRSLPESLDEKMKRYVNDYKLSQEVAKQLVNEKWQLFERAVSMQVDASLAASVLTNVLKDLARKGIDVDSIEEEVLKALLAYKDEKIGKEAIPMLLENVKPGEDIDRLIERLRLRRISREELEEIVERKMRESGIKDGSGYKVLMGLVMAEVRGRIDGAIVNEVVRKKLGL
jgi:glutamyl-tRNA(Gln) amidotransferase subunit E